MRTLLLGMVGVLLILGHSATVAAQLTPSQSQDLERLIAEGRRLEELNDSSVENAQERINAYRQAQFIDATDPRAIQGLARAREDEADARARVVAEDPAAGEAESTRERLSEAERLLQQGQVDSAEAIVASERRSNPNDPQLRSLDQAIESTRRSRRFAIGSIGTALGLGGLVGLLLFLSRKGVFKSRVSRTKKSVGAVQVVEGIGRGLSRTIDQDVFTIGASATDRDGKPLDLVISDSGSLVSRHHCTIRRRKDRFVLIDHSTNGTTLDGRPAAGDFYYPLKNNSRIEVAGVSRLTFIYE